MKALIQRVTSSKVTGNVFEQFSDFITSIFFVSKSVGDELISQIGRGLNVLVGISQDDTEKDVEYMYSKTYNILLNIY